MSLTNIKTRSCSRQYKVLLIVQESGARRRKTGKLKLNQIPFSLSEELSCSAGSFQNISFILHRCAHNLALLLESRHGRNSQTRLAPLLFLKKGCKEANHKESERIAERRRLCFSLMGRTRRQTSTTKLFGV